MNADGAGNDYYFDEVWYLKRYPDVRRAVERGLTKSGLQHYIDAGRAEGRQPFGFDEDWYLSRYLDLADAIRAGHISAEEHFRVHGWREGRLPMPPINVGVDQVYAYGAYGTNNIGDDAIFQGILEEFGNVIQIFHQKPSHGHAICIDDALLYPGLFRSDGHLIIGGGGLFYSLGAVQDLIRLAQNARSRKAQVDLLGLGCEAADETYFAEIRQLDTLVRRVTVRTETSAEIYKRITGRTVEVRPDFAFNLRPRIREFPRQKNPAVTIGVVTTGDIRDDFQPLVDAMVENMRVDWGEPINFVHIPHSQSFRDRHNNDVLVGQALRCDFWQGMDVGEIRDEGKFTPLPYDNDPISVLRTYSTLDGIVSARFHGLVFAQLTRLPMLVLPSSPAADNKNRSFVRDNSGENVFVCGSLADVSRQMAKFIACVIADRRRSPAEIAAG